jgi:hypothetical protein
MRCEGATPGETESDSLSNMLPLTHACVKCVSNTGSKLAPTIPRADCLDGERYVCWLPSGDAFYALLRIKLWVCT